MTGCVVFTGPTLPAEAVAARLPCVVLPPARQGDVWRAVRDRRPVAIGLIDGVFLHEPAVWHRELLWALSRGVHVFGAASMGALRAVELAPFGMRGVGKIFAAYRDGVWPGFADPFEDDDEVAVIHAPAALGAGALSDAMVDLRDTLLAAEAAGLIRRDERDALALAMKRLPFPERGFAALAAAAPGLAGWLPRGAVRRKRLDALALLDELAAFMAAEPPPFRAAFRFERAQVWEDFVAAEAAATSAEEALVLEELRLRPAEWRAAAAAALGRLRVGAAAPAPSTGDEKQAIDALRRRHGLARRADVDGWLADNAAAPPVLWRLLRDEAALAAALAASPAGLDVAIADELRLSGRFAALLRRARAKRAAAVRPPAPGPALDAALAWHADRCGGDAESPWRNSADFHAAVWREYDFVRRGAP